METTTKQIASHADVLRAETRPAIVSGIVTEDALVSYWPMLLAIITICTRAQLHSNTMSGFALRSKRFRAVSEQRVKDRAKPPLSLFQFLALVTLFARAKPKIPFLVIPLSSLLRNHTETLATQGISGCNYFLRYTVFASV